MSNSVNKTFVGKILNDFVWSEYKSSQSIYGIAGSSKFKFEFDEFSKMCQANLTETAILNFLSSQNGSYGLIVVTDSFIFAATDHVRSFPIYYVNNPNNFVVSNYAREAKRSGDIQTVSCRGIDEFLLSGYVHEDRTLYTSLHSLPAGKLLILNRQTDSISITTHYEYIPEIGTVGKTSELLAEFDELLNTVFKNLIEDVGDNDIWVPLSGGLDSRLVVCKLLEHGKKNIHTFTYGNSNSHEMLMARKVANQLNVSWSTISSDTKTLQSIYSDPMRIGYSTYADGLHMTPTLLDFEAILRLYRSNSIAQDSFIVNGYSGDFLFGGHIPEELALSSSRELLISQFTDKNCSNFYTQKLTSAKQQVKSRLYKTLDRLDCSDYTSEYLCSIYENWDWSERQTKAVVNGQRLYEYFEYDWRLPFWNKSLMNFWRQVPLNLRLNQHLHLLYLRQYNYLDVFSKLRSTNQIWPTQWRWLQLAGYFTRLMLGKQHKAKFYEYMFYHSYFNYQLGLFGRSRYNQWYNSTRRPRVIPLAAMNRLDEMGISYHDQIK